MNSQHQNKPMKKKKNKEDILQVVGISDFITLLH